MSCYLQVKLCETVYCYCEACSEPSCCCYLLARHNPQNISLGWTLSSWSTLLLVCSENARSKQKSLRRQHAPTVSVRAILCMQHYCVPLTSRATYTLVYSETVRAAFSRELLRSSAFACRSSQQGDLRACDSASKKSTKSYNFFPFF